MEDSPDPRTNPVAARWERVIADMGTTAEQYRNAGWTVVELHPGDVTVLTGAPETDVADAPRRDVGLDVLVPGDEYERLREAVAGRTFDSYEVFRAVDAGVVFALLAVESADGEVVVLVPTYYDRDDIDDMQAIAAERDLHTHVRPLEDDEVVTFTHDDPEPFFPEDGAFDGGEEQGDAAGT